MNIKDAGFYVALKDGCYVFPEDSLRIYIMQTMMYGKTLPKEADENWITYAVDHSMKALEAACKEAQRQAAQRKAEPEH